MSKYQTAPAKLEGIPPGIPYIVGNEAAERFSYYGMRAILVGFMTKYLADRSGTPAPMSGEDAKYYFHMFSSAVYFFPLLGSIIADAFLGKYRTILALSIVYCFGHLALAIDDSRAGLAVGLTLIAIGSGGIKPCVSAHVGDQFGKTNAHLMPRVFGWFYFSINFGSFLSTLLTPWLLTNLKPNIAPHVAFGVPGLLMMIATWAFWLGRNKFVHIPPGGWAFVKETFSWVGLKAVAKLFPIYAFVAVFWALYDQTASAWVLQGEKMDREFLLPILGKITLQAEQVQAVNPLLILIYIPLFSYVIYPAMNRVFPVTPLRKIAIGLFLTVPSFFVTAWVEKQIEAGLHPSISWQVLAYVIITAAEIFVSITCLEFSYTQAPKKMKSLIMALFLMSVSLGNAFTSAVNYFIQNEDGSVKLKGPDYYLFFAGIMFVAAVFFIFIAKAYKEETHLQDSAS